MLFSFLATATAFFALGMPVLASGVEKRQTTGIVCPATDLIRCCRILSTASSIGPLLTSSDIPAPSGDTIIGVDCFPFPITTAQSAIIGRCTPVCCPIEYALDDGTGATACFPIIDPIEKA
ncbi:hypothetical protein SCHPADRAFT_939359 [Schizopora paradoxa]|uniref:Hydrophobin n=1 Tax=Schizopora paradoxa TaxID=27342 RepID=A0A0H2RYU5_9AGAM|nr:hypothetical protein SCHPADRAFT_939359 [Schizopora paradoxa]